MADKVVDTLDDMERYGCRFERQKEVDGHSAAPPREDKMHVSLTAWNSGQTILLN